MDEMEMKARNEKIYDYYRGEFPTDDLGKGINKDITFYDLFISLNTYKDVYDLIGVDDSVIRERLFSRLAEIMEVDYKYIYDQWLMA